LTGAGIHHATARRLVRAKGAAACLQQLEWLPARPVRSDRAGYLVKAIEGAYLPPGGDVKLRLPGERPYTPPPPPPALPAVDDPRVAAGPPADVRAMLQAKGLAALAPRLAKIGVAPTPAGVE